jgi:rhodanese-related sulfurtransferase
MMKRCVFSGALLSVLALVLVACGSGTAAPSGDVAGVTDLAKNADGYTDISVEQLSGMLQDKDFTLVNVHIPYEGELPQTDLFIPFDEISDNLDQLPDRDAPIVLYCRSGSMSTSAAKELADLGYTTVYELDGGFNEWKAAGYEFLDTR